MRRLLLLLFCALPAIAAAQDIPAAIKKLDEAKALLQANVPQTIAIPVAGAQAAIDGAPAGAVLLLDAGVTYPSLTLSGDGHGKTLATLPAGARVSPSDAPQMAKVPHLQITGSNWTVRGLELPGDPGNPYEVVWCDPSASHIVLDRLYVHSSGQRRGVALNCVDGTVIHSDIRGFIDSPVGGDTQGISDWLSPGPLTIVDSYVEAASENIFIDASVGMGVGIVPSDILIKGNTLNKPAAWHDGRNHNIKNLLELKGARRVRIEDNDLSGSWADGQSGFAVVFTVRNDDQQTPWATIEHVVYVNNRVTRATGGINFLGIDDHAGMGTIRANDIQILNSSFAIDTTIAAAPNAANAARTFQLLGAPSNVVFDHVTTTVTGWLGTIFTFGEAVAPDAPVVGLSVTNCDVVRGDYGIIGNAMGVGMATLNAVAASIIWTGNTVRLLGQPNYVSFPLGTTIVP